MVVTKLVRLAATALLACGVTLIGCAPAAERPHASEPIATARGQLVSVNEINTSGGIDGGQPMREPDDSYIGVASGDNQPANVFPERMLTLTYDDGPDAFTLDLAAYLRDQGIRATFFVRTCRLKTATGQNQHDWRSGICDTAKTGPNEEDITQCPVEQGAVGLCAQYPRSLLQGLVNMGHRVANHTKSHIGLSLQSDPAVIVDEVLSAHSIIANYITDGIYAFRAPYHLHSAAVADAINSSPTLSGLLVGSVGEEVDGLDWACIQQHLTPEQCAGLYIDDLLRMPRLNGVVQMHDGNEFAVGSDYVLRLTQAFVQTIRTDPRFRDMRFVPLDAVPGIYGTRSFTASNTPSSTDFSNGAGWDSSQSYFGSIRLADVGGDGRADVCGRGISGIICGIASSNGFAAPTVWSTGPGPDFSNDDGWLPAEYGTTIMFGNVDGMGKHDVCGRGISGIYCATSDGVGHFVNRTLWTTAFSDGALWGTHASYYGSLRLADVDGNGKADVCGRDIQGIKCALSNGSGFNALTLWTSDFSDAEWLPLEYGTTIQFGDINGDGRADVCGRGRLGIYCALAKTVGTGFHPKTLWSQWGAFSDADGWRLDPSRYQSIKLGRVDAGNRADICGRAETGLVCAYSNGTNAFTRYVHVKNDYFTDSLGWGTVQYGSTLQMGDVTGDGHADLCGRGVAGIHCARAP